MSRPILTDPSLDGLHAGFRADLVATRLYNMDVPLIAHEEPDVAWALPGGPSDTRGVVVWASFEPGAAEQRLDTLMRAFDARGTSVTWWHVPFQQPEDLLERLGRRGFALRDDTAGMAMDLADLPDAVPAPDGVDVVEVNVADAIARYVDVIVRSMAIDHPSVPADAAIVRADYIGSRLGEDPLSRRFVALLDGEPVATSRLSMAGGVAGLYTMVTLPHAQRRGIGLAMAHRALLAGRDAGMRLGALQATAMGYPIYRKLGFVEILRCHMLVRPAAR
jgi:GNAT superfamily N-acetyltransferase